MTEPGTRAAISDEEVSALLEKNTADAARPYDFATQRINRMQLPLLEVVCKSFAERSGASLSALLGRDATMQFTSMESAKSADLQAALPVPASLAVVRKKGTKVVALVPACSVEIDYFAGTPSSLSFAAMFAPCSPVFTSLSMKAILPSLPM